MKENYLTLSKYHLWANKTLADSIESMDETNYRKDIKMFFGSIHKTINHLLLTDKVWYGRFTNNEFKITGLDQELITDRLELKQSLISQSEKWESFVESLNEEIFREDLIYKDSKGNHQKTNFALTLNHVFNHATHHRGQITTGIKQLGFNTPSLDLVYFIRL